MGFLEEYEDMQRESLIYTLEAIKESWGYPTKLLSAPVREAYWSVPPSLNSLTIHGDGIIQSDGKGGLAFYPTNKFKQFLTKVKNMFFSNKKTIQAQIQKLMQIHDRQATYLCDSRSDVEMLKARYTKLESDVKLLQSMCDGLTILASRSGNFRVLASDKHNPDYMTSAGYEFAGSYGDKYEMWIESKKPTTPKSKKVKKKKKR